MECPRPQAPCLIFFVKKKGFGGLGHSVMAPLFYSETLLHIATSSSITQEKVLINNDEHLMKPMIIIVILGN